MKEVKNALKEAGGAVAAVGAHNELAKRQAEWDRIEKEFDSAAHLKDLKRYQTTWKKQQQQQSG